MNKVCVAAGVCLLIVSAQVSAESYHGSLSYDPAGGVDPTDGIFATGKTWATYNVVMEWWVTDQDPVAPAGFPWKYTYHLGFSTSGKLKGAISHLVLEGSDETVDLPALVAGDVTGVTGAVVESVELQKAKSGNPDMPEDVYGLRFNPPAEEMFDIHWSFFCKRGPTWGDFYVKDGLDNICYNYNLDPGPPAVETGFLDPDGVDTLLDDVDPVGMLSDGSVDYHVLRPDSTYGSGGDPPVVPEPITLAGVSMGLIALGIARRRRRARA